MTETPIADLWATTCADAGFDLQDDPDAEKLFRHFFFLGAQALLVNGMRPYAEDAALMTAFLNAAEDELFAWAEAWDRNDLRPTTPRPTRAPLRLVPPPEDR